MELESEIRAYARERGFRQATVDRWLMLPSGDAKTLWRIVRELRLGENQARDLWEWAEEIAARDGTSLSAVLSHRSIVAARAAGGRNEQLKSVKAALRRMRFPHLVEVEDRITERIRALALPRGVQIRTPDFLEGEDIRVEIVARNAEELRAAAEALARAASTSACGDIFDLLSEPPETE